MLYRSGKVRRLYREDHKPLERHRNGQKVYGWHREEQEGDNLIFNGTYNDTADVVVKGKTLQKSEWVHKQGLTTQSGTPTPEAPIPLVSNLPAGTYKTKDWKGDWWEFTLTEDLHGLDGARDSVEFDKYSHRGYLRNKIGKLDLGTLSWEEREDGQYRAPFNGKRPASSSIIPNILCTKYIVDTFVHVFTKTKDKTIANADSADMLYVYDTAYTDASTFKTAMYGAYLVYELATPTRTALTFTKNNASTAPECPMEFLTDTPSLEYPATVWDAEGEVKARGKNLFNLDKFLTDRSAVYTKVSNVYTITSKTALFNSVEILFDKPIYVSISGTVTNNTTVNARVDLLGGGTLVAALNATAVTPVLNVLVDSFRLNWTTAGQFALRNIQIEEGSIATPYEPYRPEVTATIPALRSNHEGTVYDEFEVKTGKLTRRIGRIESYNGEDVGDDWISSAGALDTGATVEYVLAEPIEEQYTPVILPTYYPTTVVETTNANYAELTTTATVKVEDY